MAPLDPQARAFIDQVAALGLPSYEEQSVEESRRQMELGAVPVSDLTAVEDVEIAGVPVRLYRPHGADAQLPTLVWLHGGGWVLASLETHNGICQALAARAGCRVASVAYRLAPEHPFPAAVDDAWAVTQALAGDGPLAVGGDSAGGTLTAGVALRARDSGLPLALQILVYPATDFRFDTPSYEELAEGYGLTRDSMRWFWRQYLADEADGAHPEASPLRAPDLGGLAPALVITAEYDVLRDEGEAYAARLREFGVPTTLSRYEGQIHGFVRMASLFDRAEDALDECAAALREAFSTRR